MLPTPNYDFTAQIGHLLRRAYQRHLAIFQANAADPRLTSVQFVTLCALHDHGPEHPGRTDPRHRHRPGHHPRHHRPPQGPRPHRLRPRPRDRRKTIVRLTGAGQDAVTAMIPHARTITERTMGDLDPVERVALLHLLRKMILAS